MNKVLTFAVGAAVGCSFGALAALALAPRSGAETRELATERAGAFADGARDFNAGMAYYAKGIASDARDFNVGIGATAQNAVRGAIKKGGDALKGVGGEEGNVPEDDLTAKINAARERIAERVAETADGQIIDVLGE